MRHEATVVAQRLSRLFLYNFSLPSAPDDDDVEWDELWVECGRKKEWRRVKKLQQLEINLKGLYSMSFNVV